MSTARSAPPPEGAVETGPKVGRRIGIIVFWLLAAYVIGMSSISVISALYWPESAPRPSGPLVAPCAVELRALEQALVNGAAEQIARRDARGMQGWLQGWDRRFATLSGGCGPLDETRVELAAARAEMEQLLRRYAGRTAKRQQRILRALEPWSAEAPTHIKKELE